MPIELTARTATGTRLVAFAEELAVGLAARAGAAHVAASWTDSVTPLEVNVLGTHYLLEAVREFDLATRVLVPGSAAVYRPSDHALSEDDPVGATSPYGFSKLAQELGAFLRALTRGYEEMDCSLLEVNPLVTTKDGRVLALDAKMNFDDNAMYRHPDLRDLRDLTEEDPLEVEASKFSLNYIHLDGNIGCMVNGAGLAMATMDIIKLAGGEPANFLDVGGGANAEQIRNAFKILMSDANVRAVLINIFGGILRCDVLAQGVIAAVRELGVPAPIVIRMEGTNVEEGKRLLKESGMNFTTADGMDEAAENVVKLAK